MLCFLWGGETMWRISHFQAAKKNVEILRPRGRITKGGIPHEGGGGDRAVCLVGSEGACEGSQSGGTRYPSRTVPVGQGLSNYQ